MKKNRVLRRGLSMCLALLLCLTLLPAAALAAPAAATPRITAIGGNENLSISTNNSGNGWSYDAASTTLTLNNYNGGRIEVVGDKNKSFTLKLVGSNTIKNSGSGYGLTVTSEDQSSLDSPGNYMTFTVTGDSGARLRVNGIDIVKRVNFIIGGSANVVSETTERGICALKGGGTGNCSVTIQDNTNVTLRSGVEQTQNSFCLVPIMGNLTIDTSGEIMIDASNTGGSAIRLGNGNVYTYLRRVKEMTVKWNTDANYLHRHHTTPCAENTGTTDTGEAITIYRTGPYVWVLFRNSSGTLGFPRLNNANISPPSKFIMDDVITISAKTPEKGKRFTHWTWECVDKSGNDISLEFLNGTSAASANAEIKIPDPENIKPAAGDRNLYFTANYADIPTTGVTLDKDSLELVVTGSSETLTAAVQPAEASQSVTWTSSDETVAKVDENGTVTAVGAGEATITATAAVAAEGGERPSASCTVTVTEPTYTVTLNPNEGTIADGKNVTVYTRGTGAKLPTDADITREGYLFRGWYEAEDCSGSPVTEITRTDEGDKIFYAKWALAHTVTAYGLYGGVMGITPGETFTAKYAAGDPVGLQIGKREGYTLRGLTLEGINEDALRWDAEGEESEQRSIHFAMPEGDVTVTVNWRSNRSSSPRYSVTAEQTENGSVSADVKNAKKGSTVTITVKPEDGFMLDSLTVTDKDGNELELTDKGDGKYTFTMPRGEVTVKATFMEDNTVLNFFYDVPNDAYYYEAVKWAVEKGITSGIGNDLFGSGDPCTRAQIVTFLWRAAGSPVVNYAMDLADVDEGAYYAEAVRWALSEGVTSGTSAATFGPEDTCTRAQAVTFLFKAMNAAAEGKADFADVADSDWFASAVAWAVQNGVTAGIGGGRFGSGDDCTRAQIVTFLFKAYNK